MKLYHWIIPTKHNQFDPHTLRTTGTMVFLAIILLITPIYNALAIGKPQVLGYATNVTTSDVLKLSNQERIDNGLAPLVINQKLVSAASAKANDMFIKNYWAHNAPDGTTPWSFIDSSGYDFLVAGENLAKGFSISSGVVAGWMNSPTHKENVLNTNFKEVGYAVINGELLGEETTLVVAMYGAQNTPEPIAATQIVDTDNTPATTQNTGISAQKSTANQSTSTAIETGSKETMLQKTANTYSALNWGQKISLLLISIMTLLVIMKHTLIWRVQKRNLRHIWFKAHPIGQLLIIGISIAITLINGVGVVL